MLEQAAAASEQQTSGGGVNDLENSALVRLLERRETSMRLSPLLLIASAGKNISHDGNDPAMSDNQIKVA